MRRSSKRQSTELPEIGTRSTFAADRRTGLDRNNNSQAAVVHLVVSPTHVTSKCSALPVGPGLDPLAVTALDLYEAHPAIDKRSRRHSAPPTLLTSPTSPGKDSVGLLPNVQYVRVMGVGSFATEDLLWDVVLRSGVAMRAVVAIFTVPFRTSWTADNGDILGFQRFYTGSRQHRFSKVTFVANHQPNLGGSVFEFMADEVDFVLIPPMGYFQPTDAIEMRRMQRIAQYWQTLIDKLRKLYPRTKFTLIGTEAWGGNWLERAMRLNGPNFEAITRNEYRRRIPPEEFRLVTTALSELRAAYPHMWPTLDHKSLTEKEP